jgi:hypothetical protein
VNAALSASPRARAGAVTALLLLVVAVVVAVLATNGRQTASGAADEDSTSFRPVGNGSLPTSAPSELGEPREPLSAEETGYAIHLAESVIPDGATDVYGAEGAEFLYADLPEDLESTDRQAVTVHYDYTSGTTYQSVVDLASGDVVDTTATTGLQPPTSSDEADAAIALAIASEKKLGFMEEFESAQGVPLISPDQVTYVAGTFLFDGSTTTGQECGEDRCAQLMVQVANGGYLSTWDFVVNLSTKSIVTIK